MINVDNIYKQFGKLQVLKGVSCKIEKGEKVVVIGPSGSGKSTMVRLLNRLIEPTRGQVLIDGVDIAKISDAELREVRRKKIAMVFQSFALMPHMTVLDNTAFGMELAGINAEERREKALDALRQVDLLAFHHITVFGRLEVFDRILRPFVAVVFIALASADRHHTGNGSRTPQTKQNLIRFFHLHFP